jgi:hypothetical protein
MRSSSCLIEFANGDGDTIRCGKRAVADCADCGMSICSDCRTECCGESFCDYCYDYPATGTRAFEIGICWHVYVPTTRTRVPRSRAMRRHGAKLSVHDAVRASGDFCLRFRNAHLSCGRTIRARIQPRRPFPRCVGRPEPGTRPRIPYPRTGTPPVRQRRAD